LSTRTAICPRRADVRFAIAIGHSRRSGQIPVTALNDVEFIASGAHGQLRAVPCASPRRSRTRRAAALILPSANADEAAGDGPVFTPPPTARCHRSLARHGVAAAHRLALLPTEDTGPDLREVRGQQSAKRALEIAAAGGHSCCSSDHPRRQTMLAPSAASCRA